VTGAVRYREAGGLKSVTAGLRRELFEALVSLLTRCSRVLHAHPPAARVLRAMELRRYLETLYLHEEMLADQVRLGAYRAAIERYVTPADCVVDIGTGTGVLAFFAAAKAPRKLYALEHSKPLLDYARGVAAANDIDNVTFVASSSRRFQPEEPIDVIVQELMGIALFDENMVETILDVRDRCLRPGGRIIPARFELYLEPVQLQERERIPLIQERRIAGLRFPPTPVTPGSEYYFREIFPEHVSHLLCEPVPAFSFDLTTLTRAEIPSQFRVAKPVVRSGQVDGICIYFKAIFDDDISFSTGLGPVKTHWPMLLYRTPARSCHAGGELRLTIEAPDLSDYFGWSWQIEAAH